jgi:energy-coupling factor transporter ATP-binding protein EcfA2
MESAIKLETPSTAIIAGPSGSGKTTFIFEALKHSKGLFKDPPKQIYYCFGVYQPMFDRMKEDIENIQFIEGIPSRDMLESWAMSEPSSKLLIMDDLLQEGSKNSNLVSIYCQFSHHYNITAWYVTQNVYFPGKEFRTISLNTHYFMLFKNYRDERQIQTLARQIFSNSVNYMMEAYRKAVKERYNFLLIDLSPHSETLYKLRSHILPGQLMTVYLPEKRR